MRNNLFTSFAILGILTTPVLADDLLSGENALIKGNLCLGEGCEDPESYSGDSGTLRLSAPQTQIEFIDTSDQGDRFQAMTGASWRMRISAAAKNSWESRMCLAGLHPSK